MIAQILVQANEPSDPGKMGREYPSVGAESIICSYFTYLTINYPDASIKK